MNAVVLGVDPGLDGAIALMVSGELMDVADMPTRRYLVGKKNRRALDCETLEEIFRGYAHHCAPHETPVLAIEKPQPRPGNGAAAAFSSGQSWGGLLELARNLGWVTTIVPPAIWKKKLALGPDKFEAVELAETWFPTLAAEFRGPKGGLRDGRAEACLIAAFAWNLRSEGVAS